MKKRSRAAFPWNAEHTLPLGGLLVIRDGGAQAPPFSRYTLVCLKPLLSPVTATLRRKSSDDDRDLQVTLLAQYIDTHIVQVAPKFEVDYGVAEA